MVLIEFSLVWVYFMLRFWGLTEFDFLVSFWLLAHWFFVPLFSSVLSTYQHMNKMLEACRNRHFFTLEKITVFSWNSDWKFFHYNWLLLPFYTLKNWTNKRYILFISSWIGLSTFEFTPRHRKTVHLVR